METILKSFYLVGSFLVNIRDENNLEVKDGCRVWDMGMFITTLLKDQFQNVTFDFNKRIQNWSKRSG